MTAGRRWNVGGIPDTECMATRLTRAELLRWRLRCQRLTGQPQPGCTAPDVVSRLFALQGQDLPGVLWSIGLRADGEDQDGVRAAFDHGHLIRTWPFRGTLHVLNGRDLGWVLALTRGRMLGAEANLRRNLGLDDHTLAAGGDAIRGRLCGGRTAGRDDLIQAVDAAGVDVPDRRAAVHLIRHAAIQGAIVLGPFDGTRQQFVLSEEWIRAPRTQQDDDAVRELVTRYLKGHGPAAASDLATWAKLPLGTIRAGIDAAGADLTAFDYGNTVLWAHTDTLDAVAADESARVLALPGFDELLLGYSDRTASLATEHAPAIVPGGNGVFRPTVVSRGRVRGVWRRTTAANKTTVTATPLDGVFPQTVVAGLGRALDRYGRFLGTPIELTLG